jgi:kynurenine formamidase
VPDLAAAGDIEPGEALLIRTGWDARYGTDEYMPHPYLSAAARIPMPGPHDAAGRRRSHRREPRPASGRGQRCQLLVGVLRVAGADGAPARVLALL